MKLETYMQKRNLSDEMFADLVGVDRSTVVKWRNGSRRPNVAAIAAIELRTNGKVRARDFLDEAVK